MEIDINSLLGKYRTVEGNDFLSQGMRINRLFGLQDLIVENLNKNSVVCEIGSLFGNSSSLFAYYCREVYCVDVFNHSNSEKIFKANMSIFDNVHMIKNFSVKAAETFEDSFFDLVYIDAGHEFKHVVEDVQNWLPKVKKNGFLSGHDYYSFWNVDVVKALDSLNIKPDKVYEDSSWIKRI
jgi:hypothetical protein